MPAQPFVTVLMPVYNGGDYLKLSIESILTQTYRDFELLIINDCSTDHSLDTIRSFRDPRIVVHSNAVNLGQTKSLNAGLKIASGKYIVINDADDLSLPERIEKQLGFITRHPEYVVVGASSYIMDRSGRIRRAFLKPTDTSEIPLWILSDTPLIHGSVIMDKQVIVGGGGYNEDFRICQDYELWSSLIRRGFRITNLPDCLVVIRHYSDSTSFKEKEMQTLENGKILYANISSLTDLRISLDDAIRQRLFFAFPGTLEQEDFRKAEGLFTQELGHLKDGATLEPRDLPRILKRFLLKPYSKRALAEVKKGRSREGRNIAHLFLRRFGLSAIPFLIYLVSYGGPKVAERILDYYEKGRELSATRSHRFHVVKGRRQECKSMHCK